jgi:beta-glucanase (GH16 family)
MRVRIFLIICIAAISILLTSNLLLKENGVAENKLIWSEEFDYKGLPDSTKWSYDVGDGCPKLCGWGHNELQYYTEKNLDNARVENGILTIEAHKQTMGSKGYTSARLVGKNKADFKYAKIDIRAKVTGGLGAWSAIWMLPTHNTYGNWPKSGEIDIMEHVGFERDSIFGTPHTEAFNGMIFTQKSGGIEILDSEDEYYTYTIDWKEDRIDWYVNEHHYHTFHKAKDHFAYWPFDQKFHLILNLAIGGNWGGKHGVDASIWPRTMEIDYIRVYSNESTELQ